MQQQSEFAIIFPPCDSRPVGIRCVPNTLTEVGQTIKGAFRHPLSTLGGFISSGFFWSSVYMVLSLFINAIFQALTDSYYIRWLSSHPDIPKDYSLPDMGTDFLPFIDLPYLPVCICTAVLGITFLRFFFTPYRTIILRRFFFLQGTVYILRSFSVFSTYLPPPVPCSSGNKDSLFVYAMKILIGERTCHDLMFCPHTAALIFCTLFWYHYSEKAPIYDIDLCKHNPSTTSYGYPLRFTLEKAIVMTVAGSSGIVFVMCRRHYTFDVYIAAVIALLLFKLYHHYILYIHTRSNWINTFFKWFEDGAPDIPLPATSVHFDE